MAQDKMALLLSEDTDMFCFVRLSFILNVLFLRDSTVVLSVTYGWFSGSYVFHFTTFIIYTVYSVI